VEDKKLYYFFEVSFVIVFAVALLLKTTQLISTVEASVLLVVSFLLGIGGAYYGYKYKKKDAPKQDKPDTLTGKKKIPHNDNVVKSFHNVAIIFFFVIVAVGMIIAGASYISNSRGPAPKISEAPLIITFTHIDDSGESSSWSSTNLDPARGSRLVIPTNTKTEISYSILARSSEERLTNVKLGCDYC